MPEGPRPASHRIRRAHAADASAIARIVNAAYVAERFFVEGDRTSADEVRALMARGTFLVATAADEGAPGDSHEEDGPLVGGVFVETRGETGRFGMLAVEPARQGRRLGRQLVAAAEALAREAGCQRMEIAVVNLRTPLFPFYERLGYRVSGREPYVRTRQVTRPCHFVLMSKILGPAP